MNGAEIFVVLATTFGVLLVNWYFFAGHRKAVAASARSEYREIVVEVDGGYSPATVRLQAGLPARLIFDRKDDGGCSEEVVIPDFGVKKFLPTSERTVVEFTPENSGTFEFTCGMSMLRGTLIVE